MSLAVIQMVSQPDVRVNLAQARRLLEQAAEAGARLAVLPENFAAMGRRDVAELGRAEAVGQGPILPWLKQAARDLKLWIVAGTLPLPPAAVPEGKACACSLLIDDQGQVVARYDKLHLFDVDVADNRGRYRESDDYAHGQQIVVADTPVGRLGLTVCYDLRFPELYSALREAGGAIDHRAVGLYRRDRRGALGGADPRAGHRNPVLHPCGGPGWYSSGSAGNLWPCSDR
jgi:predicted amidohydrolase